MADPVTTAVARPWWQSRIVMIALGQFGLCALLSIQYLLGSGKLDWKTGVGAVIGAIVATLRLRMPDLFTGLATFDDVPGQLPRVAPPPVDPAVPGQLPKANG